MLTLMIPVLTPTEIQQFLDSRWHGPRDQSVADSQESEVDLPKTVKIAKKL